ncbi:MAG: hypothetical protein HXX09_14270 [Bacteroidetes bacterium]|nr:hypothetical protein [Bacteroidota bacterium]
MKKIFLILFIFSNGFIVKSQELNKAYFNAVNYLKKDKRIKSALLDCKLIWPRNNLKIRFKYYKKGKLQFDVFPFYYPLSLGAFEKNLKYIGYSESEIEYFSSTEKKEMIQLSSLSSNKNSELKLVFSEYKNRLIRVDIFFIKNQEYCYGFCKTIEILFLFDEKDEVKRMYVGPCLIP